MTLTRPTVLPLAVAALVSALVPLTAGPVAAGGCSSPNTTLLSRNPQVTALPNGAEQRVWDTGNRSNQSDELRISEVMVPASSPLQLTFWTSGALTRLSTPGAILAKHDTAVAASNGDVFDPYRGGPPYGYEVLHGVMVKGAVPRQEMLLFDRSGKPYLGHIGLGGTVTAAGNSQRLTGVNMGALAGSGVNLYTHVWGSKSRPYGDLDVVLAHGKVTAIRRGSARGQAPSAGRQILTGTGAAASFLAGLHVGEAVTVTSRVVRFNTPFRVAKAISHGARYVLDGTTQPPPCSSRNEELRPRTAVGWDKDGNLLLVAVSGRATVSGTPYGGSTLHNMAYYLKKLGAYNAVAMDGGTSTTLVTRTKVPGGAVHRVDHPGATQRQVPTFLGIA